jgi:hypothetical protein
MRKRYLVAGLVSSVVYVLVGPFLTILSLHAATRAGQPEEDVFPIGIVFGWVLFAGPLTLLIVATALLGEVCARRVQRTMGKLLVVSLVSAALLFGTAALLSTLGSAFLTDWSSMSLTLLPGWLLAGAGPRFWSWIAELDAAAAELDAEPAEVGQELP